MRAYAARRAKDDNDIDTARARGRHPRQHQQTAGDANNELPDGEAPAAPRVQ